MKIYKTSMKIYKTSMKIYKMSMNIYKISMNIYKTSMKIRQVFTRSWPKTDQPISNVNPTAIRNPSYYYKPICRPGTL